MAVRHEVENLIRRGNIFYWRPRVPAAFIHCRPGSRLSLSLHCSDHKKAQIIARQLNMQLAEMKMRPKDMMGDKERLQKLFVHTFVRSKPHAETGSSITSHGDQAATS
ncbi:DUF6538 domain-containing protein [Agrobacterium tumefaciens]|uniref:DUF6538 domain-containing protein n=1 Tax=Agrobacterium tumefaciens TaxID=358 RepID=UPI001F171395